MYAFFEFKIKVRLRWSAWHGYQWCVRKRFVSGISISLKCECNFIMQIQYTKNLNPGRFELGTTLS